LSTRECLKIVVTLQSENNKSFLFCSECLQFNNSWCNELTHFKNDDSIIFQEKENLHYIFLHFCSFNTHTFHQRKSSLYLNSMIFSTCHLDIYYYSINYVLGYPWKMAFIHTLLLLFTWLVLTYWNIGIWILWLSIKKFSPLCLLCYLVSDFTVTSAGLCRCGFYLLPQ
jgi:hypothetical protein